jgi:branched-chain amino acid transport system permease protein
MTDNKTKTMRLRLLFFVVIPAVLLSIPLIISNPYFMRIMIILYIYSILAVSLNLVMGLTGLLSISHAAFFGIGAYTSALLALKGGLSFWLCLPAAGLVSAIFAFLVGFPVLRLRGHYLAMATLTFNEIIRLITYNWDGLTRGASGIPNVPAPKFFSFEFGSHFSYYYLVFFFLLLTVLTVARIFYSHLGRAFRSMKEDEILSQALGIEARTYRVFVFVLCAFYAGLAGSLYVHYSTFVSAEILDVFESVLLIIMVYIGGAGSVLGSLLGAVLVILLPEALRGLESYRMVIFGGILILVIMFYPHGLLGKRGPPLEQKLFSPLRRTS